MTNLIQPVDPHMSDAFVECHADGHQWRHQGFVGAPTWKPPFGMNGAVARYSVCQNCGGERARWYTRSGEVQNRYKMRDGYYHKRSTPDDYAPTRLEYRQRVVVTLFEQFAASIEQAPKRARKAAAR